MTMEIAWGGLDFLNDEILVEIFGVDPGWGET